MQDLGIIRDNFSSELTQASNGATSSLSFLKTAITHLYTPPKKYQVMVIGGTNFSSALVDREGLEIELRDIKKEKLPKYTASAELFDFIISKLDLDIKEVCVNFAFPINPVKRGEKIDGVLTKTTKEQKFTDLIGKNVGEELENYVSDKTGRKVDFFVANDTTCLLLASSIICDPEKAVVLILGTGFNMGIYESGFLVNLEAGNFDKFNLSDNAKVIDENSQNKGEHLFEKETSGAYLYQHFNLQISSKDVGFEPIKSTQELFEIAFGKDARDDVKKIANDTIRHSAERIASVLAGTAEFKKSGIETAIQGSLFTNEYKDMVFEELEKLTDFSLKFIKIDNSSRLGAALLI